MTDTQTDVPESDYATGWRPTKGDKVAGTVTDISATDGGYGVYPIVTLGQEGGGEVAVHAFHTVLRRELARRRPQIGDELEITYLGKQQGKSGSIGYDGYRVKSNKDVQGYDWDLELPEEQRQSSADPPIAASTPTPGDPDPMSPDADEDVPF